MSQPTLPIDYAAQGLALLMSSQYFNSLFNTERAASHFLGRPVTTENTLFFPALGGRNGAMGLSILLLSLRGDRWAAGVIYACCTAIGVSDLYVCYKWQGNWKMHAFGTAALGAMGAALLRAA